jgi:hypothetical protein
MMGRPRGSIIEAQEGSDVTPAYSKTKKPRQMMLGFVLLNQASNRATIVNANEPYCSHREKSQYRTLIPWPFRLIIE